MKEGDPRCRTTLRGLGFVILLQVFFFVMLLAGQLVPDQPILRNLTEAVESGTYGPSFAPDRMGGMADTFTECVVVGTGMGAEADESLLSRAVRMPRLSNCEEGQQQILTLAEGGEVVRDSYFKYWAGYTVLTRPLLATIGLDGLRIVSGALLATALLAAFLALRAHVNSAAAVLVVGSFILGTNVMSTPSTSFSQSLSIAVIFGSVALTARGAARSWEHASIAVILGAAVFCFVDLLTTPAIPWALCAFALGAASWVRLRTVRATLIGTALGLVLWPLTFAATWMSRWIIAALFLGTDYTRDVIRSNIEFRTGGAHEDIPEWFGAGIVSNAGYWGAHVSTWWIVLLGCVTVGGWGLTRAVRQGGGSELAVACILATSALVIPAWYLVVANHSLLHEFFTSRGVPTFLGMVGAAMVAAAGQGTRTEIAGPSARWGTRRRDRHSRTTTATTKP